MNNNLHVYRNLGVPCVTLKCRHCSEETPFSVYFELDSNRRKQCSVGCNDCGRGYVISQDLYDQLYDLSFEYDRLRSGEIDSDEFDELAPPDCHALFSRFAESENDISKSLSIPEAGRVAKTADASPAESWPKPAALENTLPQVTLTNSTSDMLGTGYVLAILAGLAFGTFEFLVELPSWMSGARLLGSYGVCMAIGLAAGALLSFRRFPEKVKVSQAGIEVEGRGRMKTLHRPLSAVSRVNFGEGAKYLTIWFSSGETFVVRAGKDQIQSIERYFGKTR
ncbi:hypothetical protein [Pelagicoccus sp. SDUM812002]|uniref:hypothetical protein n=1 Tax=Pelagicoccus sp. SDUM812002 TaxID=3041266 RepID=UPI00280DDE5C|nr:hypothetical protein [Pelagicoccus sp. SDUM812002]MDQ8183984.1 hypothetical protein [Pelagicoccus sp. SDUM812002]